MVKSIKEIGYIGTYCVALFLLLCLLVALAKYTMPQATVVHVNYEIVHDIWQPAEKKFDFFVMQSFVSEAICIGGSCSCCKDIMVTEKYLCFVYETSLKAELNESMDDAARFRTLAMVVSKKAKQKGYPMIKASIGMDYGEVSKIPINLHDNRFPRFIWKGDAAERAEQTQAKPMTIS